MLTDGSTTRTAAATNAAGALPRKTTASGTAYH
ncbi:alpha/beta hydrolase, partial [Rhizobium sp. PEPV16]